MKFSKNIFNVKAIELIYNLYEITSSTLNLSQLLNLTMEMTLNYFNAEVGSILLLDEQNNQFSPQVTFGLSLKILNKLKYKKNKILNIILNTTEPIIISNYNKKYSIKDSIKIKSILCSSLVTKDKIIGAIFLVNKSIHDKLINFTKDDLEILKIINNNIAFSIENAQLYQQVLEIKNFNENMINSVQMGVITTDLQGKILFINDTAKFIFNIITNIVNKNIDKILNNLTNKNKILLALKKQENLINLESILHLDIGIEKILNISISVLNNNDKEIIGYVISINDVTEKKDLENRVTRNEQLAALGELSAGIAHEIKNPLTSIKGFSQILPNKLEDHEFLLKFSQIIKIEVERLNNIIEGLLQFARPKSDKKENHSIENIIHSTIELIGYQFKKSNISVNINLIPLPFVYCDPGQIEQVIINILLNAIQSIKNNGKIDITNKLIIKKSAENLFYEYNAVYIKDTGAGIQQENLSKLFNPFYTTKTKGTGLGLSISHRIITEHKGFIEVFSKINSGTTFIIYLPTTNNWH